MSDNLIKKYDVPGPRYTSYPTVPYWDQNTFSVKNWKNELSTLKHHEGISLYIHLPFCESLCTYCGCTTRITKNHRLEEPYIRTLIKEWQLYVDAIGFAPEIKELHFGGGTPTFFTPENLKKLLNGLLKHNHNLPLISVEGHPNSTTKEHLSTLYKFGARRLSLGIQDLDYKVQKQINRVQSLEQVEKVCKEAREVGYTSINFDLIFGLPHQTRDTIKNTIARVIELAPDRIAYYSYAHVPWIKKAQKSYEQFLPTPQEKRELYELGKLKLEEYGYIEIGMDHFALPSDDLCKAFQNGTLHRNFMGYTTQATNYAIGLGASAISDIWTGFSQNFKSVEKYQEAIDLGDFPLLRGHILNERDLILRQHILEVMCQFHTDIESYELFEIVYDRLFEMEKDGLLRWEGQKLIVTDQGKPYVRNICMSFDEHMIKKKPDCQLFSQTV